MKKRIVSAVAILALLFGPMSIQTAKSQILILEDEEEEKTTEEEIFDEENDSARTYINLDFDYKFELDVDEQGLELPIAPPNKGGITIDWYAPLGGEIFLLGCLGGAYLLGKRRRKE